MPWFRLREMRWSGDKVSYNPSRKRKFSESQLAGDWPVGYLQRVEGLNSGLPKTNPASGREEDLNLSTPDYKSSALTTRPCVPPCTFSEWHAVSFTEGAMHLSCRVLIFLESCTLYAHKFFFTMLPCSRNPWGNLISHWCRCTLCLK